MTDFLCLPARAIQSADTISTDIVTDTEGRQWLCVAVAELTEAIKESFGSPHAAASWELNKLNRLLAALGVPVLGLFDSWPDEIQKLYHMAITLNDVNDMSLAAELGQLPAPDMVSPICLDKLRPAHWGTSSLSRSEQADLMKLAHGICRAKREMGSEKYYSGELRQNRYNYAKDIIRAADFAAGLMDSIPSEAISLDTIQQVLQQGEVKYLEQNEDMEGFGIGTLRLIAREIAQQQ